MDRLAFEPEIGVAEFRERYRRLCRQVYTSDEFAFDAVMRLVYRPPAGTYLVDPFCLHDGSRWHLFYVTGRMEHCEAWGEAARRNDFAAASRTPYEEGEGHAVGPSLFDLRYHSSILTEFQGEFSLGLQGDSGIVRHRGRWVDLYTCRGPAGSAMCLATSDDLYRWELDPANPVLRPPAWALDPGKSGHSWIQPLGDRYLVYYTAQTAAASCAGLYSTPDFRVFTDHGPVSCLPYQMRGTVNIEAAMAFPREGVWHFFCNAGTGTYHAVSNRPDRFSGLLEGEEGPWRDRTLLQSYCLGPFHAARVFRDPVSGTWYMSATRKEEQRRMNRKAGLDVFRGSMRDESPLTEGLYLCKVVWRADQPILERLSDAEMA